MTRWLPLLVGVATATVACASAGVEPLPEPLEGTWARTTCTVTALDTTGLIGSCVSPQETMAVFDDLSFIIATDFLPGEDPAPSSPGRFRRQPPAILAILAGGGDTIVTTLSSGNDYFTWQDTVTTTFGGSSGAHLAAIYQQWTRVAQGAH